MIQSSGAHFNFLHLLIMIFYFLFSFRTENIYNSKHYVIDDYMSFYISIIINYWFLAVEEETDYSHPETLIRKTVRTSSRDFISEKFLPPGGTPPSQAGTPLTTNLKNLKVLFLTAFQDSRGFCKKFSNRKENHLCCLTSSEACGITPIIYSLASNKFWDGESICKRG